PAPARFVWRTDKDGIISSVSPELAAAVGVASADIAGLDWSAAAAKIGIQNAERATAAIARHDTWSGITVLWPIAGREQARPVDLAALPVFDRERRFQGYRGFGVFREPVALQSALAEPGGEAREVPVFEERAENVVPLRVIPSSPTQRELSETERHAFREIARSIGEQINGVNGR